MKVLVLEEQPGAACDAALDLVSAGHQVVRCHGADEPAFPCRGMSEGQCPLDQGDVEVAVIVQSEDPPVGAGDSADDGGRCALRRHIPLVVSGGGNPSPLGPWASAVVDDPTSLTSTVEAVGRMPSPRHGDVAEGAFAGVLEAHGLDPALAGAVVVRHGGRSWRSPRSGWPGPCGVSTPFPGSSTWSQFPSDLRAGSRQPFLTGSWAPSEQPRWSMPVILEG
jgi:hypothetical protein